MKEKSAFINSNGCIPNQLEGKKIVELLKSLGYRITNDLTKADIIIFNACGFCADKIEESCRALSTFAQLKSASAQLILTGCLDRICHDRLEEFREAVTIKSYFELSKFFRSKTTLDNLYVSDYIENDQLLASRRDIFHVITSTGCLGRCSYCAIKKARGNIRSKLEDEIVKEIQGGIHRNYKKFILWADDLGAYGSDISTTVISLLEKIGKAFCKDNIKLFLHRMNPQWLKKYKIGLNALLKSGIIKLIYSPIQSGSNKVLELMNRSYTSEDVISTFGSIKNGSSTVIIKTDIMVGFPSESDDDFHQTLDLLRNNIIDDIEIFKYGGIKSTPAFYMQNQINDEIVRSRIALLWRCFPHFRFYLREENKKYSLIDKGNMNEEGLCWTLKNINPDYYE